MNVMHDAIIAGIDVGLIRSLQSLPKFQVPSLDALRKQVRNIVEPALATFNPTREWGYRGQATYGELAAMAVAARIRYSEDSLSQEAAAEIMEPLTQFLNSWLHE